jgi:uncharacterized protein YndB with AHSA1/START domain
MSKITTEQKGNVMLVTRTFDAHRELVFEVHSDCKHLVNWYGGDEWPLAKCEMDFRPGGRWTYCFTMQNEEPCGLAIFREIRRPEKIVYKDHFLDENGEISKELPPSLITIELTEESGKTTIVNRWEYLTEADLNLMLDMGAVEGLTEIWDRLDNYLKQL